ncbi:MAG TPA: AarF/ABC1/UbiB kinase family protein [Candidatus Saccharimonadales bacterium]|nr:AarF/ABC1/UbiB kinase family protein [Candidatus Saccharimonadales bacterium]
MNRFRQILQAAASIFRARLRDKYSWQQEFVVQCEHLGGVYIKFLQMLAAHQTTKPIVQGASNDMIYEQVPYEFIDVEAELGSSRQWFLEVAATPFAAGSYGQVYHATLTNGQPVIIKILRPSIRKTLRHDLRFLNIMAVLLGWFTESSVFDIRAITREFSRTTAAETDYKREANNGEWLRGYFNKRATLVIPRSYPEYGSRHILVQQYVPGISLATAMAEQQQGCKIDEVVYQATGSNIWQQLDIMGSEALSAILYADQQMVDPHPGNIRLLPDNKVALIDFGMMSAAPRNRAAFVTVTGEMVKAYEDRFEPGKFAIAMLGFLDGELHDALQVVASQQSDDYMEAVEKFVTEYVRLQAGDSLTQHHLIDRQMARLFHQVINRGNKLGLRMSGDNIMLQRSMNMFLSTVRAIGEGHDGKVHFGLLHGIMKRVYQDALEHGFNHESLPEMSEERAYEVTANWLTMIAEKDRQLYGLVMKGGLA